MKTRFLACAVALFFIYATGVSSQQLGEPFEGIDQTWQNGADRRDSSAFGKTGVFTPNVIMDINYNYSFNHPIDNTVVGSTALARSNELQLAALHLGGDFVAGNAHARIMTQFGLRSTVISRNDLSAYRGQYDLDNAYRYLSEAYAGYHINTLYGVNIDAGLFMSYIGLNSYYQPENWEYQASFTSDNTPWFFSGLRVQVHPTKNLKTELWVINGWQSYAKFNTLPGFGGNLTYMSSDGNMKLLTNDYVGFDDAGVSDRVRFHSDNSFLLRYHNSPYASFVSRAAFSLTGDIGFEKGGGVNGFDSSDPSKPAQYFLSLMFYHRLWFSENRFAWTFGGGWMKNPGRYLVLLPTGQASALPNPFDPTKTAGAFPFSANPGDQFQGYDVSTNVDYMPDQHMTIRLEYVWRHASVPYFAGPGGVTSSTGRTTTPVDPNGTWRPDLVNDESKIILAMLFRI